MRNTNWSRTLALAILVPALLNAYAQLVQGCISVNAIGVPRGMVQADDGGYAFAGWWSSGGLGYVDYEIIKLDANGAFEWGEHFDGGQVEYATCLTKTQDGGFAISGYTGSFGQGGYDIMVVKVDANGAFEWAKTAGTTASEYGFAITQTSDGGYAVAGGQGSIVYVAKLNGQGDFLWGKEVDMTSSGSEAHSIAEASDGSLLVAGFILGPNSGFLLKLDADGNKVWCKRTADGAALYAVTVTSDDHYVVAGGHYAEILGAGGFDMCVMKVDTNGAVVWDALIGGARDDQAWAVTPTSDGGFVIGGDRSYNDLDTVQPYMAKVDQDGQLLWTRIFGGGIYGNARAVLNTTDGGLALGGHGAGSQGMLLVKTDAWGLACPQCGVDSGGTAATGATLIDYTTSVDLTDGGAGDSGAPTVIPIGTAAPICTAVGIDDNAVLPGTITISPQPISRSAQGTLPEVWLRKGPVTFTLFEALGKQVLRMNLSTSSFTLDRGALPAGAYHFQFAENTRPLATGTVMME